MDPNHPPVIPALLPKRTEVPKNSEAAIRDSESQTLGQFHSKSRWWRLSWRIPFSGFVTWVHAMLSTEHLTSTPNDSERLIRFIVAGCTVGWFVLLIGLTCLAG